MNYYIEKDSQIVIHDDDRQRLVNTLLFMPDFSESDIKETDGYIVDGKIISADEYAEQQKQEQQTALINKYKAMIQAWMDAEAQKLGYDNLLTACTYMNTGVAKFDAEGEGFRAWRSAVWEKGYALIDEVLAGTREIPEKDEDVLALLPTLNIEYPTEEVTTDDTAGTAETAE